MAAALRPIVSTFSSGGSRASGTCVISNARSRATRRSISGRGRLPSMTIACGSSKAAMDSSGLVEAVDPGHYRIAGARDVHPIVDHTAGMGDPLVATHELVFRGVAEGVAHTAVVAGEADATAHSGGEVGPMSPPGRFGASCSAEITAWPRRSRMHWVCPHRTCWPIPTGRWRRSWW